MDLNQSQLIKSEWESIEIPSSEAEIKILQLIKNGFINPNISVNYHLSLLSFLKVEPTDLMFEFLFTKYLKSKVDVLIKDYSLTTIKVVISKKGTIKSADKIRIQQNETLMSKHPIYEFVLLEYVEKLLKLSSRKDKNWMIIFYTLTKLINYKIHNLNPIFILFIQNVLTLFEEKINYTYLIKNIYDLLEKNTDLIKYSNQQLYDHQKEIFSLFNKESETSKLVLYIAPTGTGKTLTPIGLSEKYKIIFVCAARHVGLALAKSAISINKKVAFAFGCSSTEEIKLHYFAASQFLKSDRTGKYIRTKNLIGKKVDNTVGDKVEIMICDIKSYLSAMYYMLAFHPKEQIITYWDEPEITLDKEEHPFHEIIHRNWKENIIPNIVLSSATLPKEDELANTIMDFQMRFPNTEIVNITSHDCKKSIPLINNNGYVVLPHMLFEDYADIKKVVKHCENYLTLLRYFDLREISRFLILVNEENYIPSHLKINAVFSQLEDVSMISIKLYYLNVLNNILSGKWGSLYIHIKMSKEKRIIPNHSIDVKSNKIVKSLSVDPDTESSLGKPLTKKMSLQEVEVEEEKADCGIYITTKDAYTLTDGPTIFLAENIEKVAKFSIQQCNISSSIMTELIQKIDFNNKLNEKISELENDLEDQLKETTPKEDDTDKKTSKKHTKDIQIDKQKGTIQALTIEIERLRSYIKYASLNDVYIPNKLDHLEKWASHIRTPHSFTSNIDERTIISIMSLNGVDNSWKVLLLLGIGVFTNQHNAAYTEIMKKLADEQKLYIIIASSDYIYGTNYQFCHGYISKDLNLTQEKIIQALGRIGRNNIQQDYSIRFRDDKHILHLFTPEENKIEVRNMSRLFVS
jgi:hypothetical protein